MELLQEVYYSRLNFVWRIFTASKPSRLKNRISVITNVLLLDNSDHTCYLYRSMKDSLHSIRRSARHFFSGTLLSRITGMLRDMSMAYAFGTDPAIAAFMVSFRFAHLLRRLFGEGALQAAFVPEFEALRHKSEARAHTFFNNLAGFLTLFLVLLIALSCIGLSGILLFCDIDPSNYSILFLTLLMLPSLLFICLFGLNASLLQCEKHYFIPSFAPVAFNIIWIAFVISLQHVPTAQAMPWLSFGVVIACIFQWLFTVPQTWKIFTFNWRSFFHLSADLRQIAKPLALGILGVSATQINNAIDSLFARFAEPEGPAFLWYAMRIQQLPIALFAIAIAGAVLPPLSRAIKTNQMDEYHYFLENALLQTWKFMIPLTAIMFVLGDSGIHLIYGHGDFSSSSVVQTTLCLWAYSFGLIPSAIVLVLAPACYANKNYYLPAIASFATLLLNGLLNTLFIQGFHLGAVSVAIATSISAWLNLSLLSYHMRLNGTSIFSRRILKNISSSFFAAAVALSATYFFRLYIQQVPFLSNTLFSASLLTQITLLLSQGAVFIFSYYLFYSIKLLSKFTLIGKV